MFTSQNNIQTEVTIIENNVILSSSMIQGSTVVCVCKISKMTANSHRVVMDLFLFSDVPPVRLLLTVAAVDGGCCVVCPLAPTWPEAAAAFLTSRRLI